MLINFFIHLHFLKYKIIYLYNNIIYILTNKMAEKKSNN